MLSSSTLPETALDESTRSLTRRFRATRARTVSLVAPLAPEDTVVQSMPDASPVKWHLAHTTWFFERFMLRVFDTSYRSPDEIYDFLFNSYYVTVGPRHCRPRRGVLSRPTLEQVLEYRRHIDQHVEALLTGASDSLHEIAGIDQDLDPDGVHDLHHVMELGLQHEMQHQELIVTDIKHALSSNPMLPAPYAVCDDPEPQGAVPALTWRRCDAGVSVIGADPEEGFCFDNELPRHRVFLEAFELAERPVTNAEYRAFVEDGGYRRPELWLSLGWDAVRQQEWEAPLYWYQHEGRWHEYTMPRGAAPLRDQEPVCHLSYFEADAYARWAGARLPTEAEWEHVAASETIHSASAARPRLHPTPLEPAQADAHGVSSNPRLGELWEWTSSSYAPYPGYTPPAGALGEYNGKFMCNQYVLRGGSCATPRAQVRPTYRNFFAPEARWQFTGIRLARSVRDDGPDRSDRPAGTRTRAPGTAHVVDSRSLDLAAGDPAAGEPAARGPAVRETAVQEPAVRDQALIDQCVRGLRETPPRLPTKYLYDARGSRLFERITALPEYTLTRDELLIFERHLDEMAALIGPRAWIIELGSGDGRKTRRLLRALEDPAGYTPIEVSGEALDATVSGLAAQCPDLDVRPVRGDFFSERELPIPDGTRRVAFFPGSTIGNFDEGDARELMRRLAGWVGPGGGLLIGADLVKPVEELLPAYSDVEGVTAEFNLNLLDRLNREAGADIDRSAWCHRASWNAERSRMESHLVSRRAQRVTLGGHRFEFDAGDAIRTEISRKYSPALLRETAEPFVCRREWFDPRQRFMVAYMEAPHHEL